MTLPRRSWVALVLVMTAIVVPCSAWYWAGSRSAEREAQDIRTRPILNASSLAERHADHLAVRFESLRQIESRRPFLHYQSHFHDPHSDCECSSVTPSPLAMGTSDPLIWTYFQIDPLGQLTLPTLNEQLHRERGATWLFEQTGFLEVLIPAVPSILAALNTEPDIDVLAPPPAGWEILPTDARIEYLDQESWALNMELCGIQTDPLAVPVVPVQKQALEMGLDGGTIEVEVLPVVWRTVAIGQKPTVIGLRRVRTPMGFFCQGYVVSHEVLERSLAGLAIPAFLRPGPPTRATDRAVYLPGTEWSVRTQVNEALLQADRQAGVVMSRFHRVFLFGTLAALIAGLGLVALVWQGERLGRQRSRFAASAAHELRTPLAAMRMYGEMIAEDLGDPGATKKYARHIAQEADRLGRVVTNVMNYSRLERGALTVVKAPGDISLAIQDCLRTLDPVIQSGGAVLSTNFPKELPRVPFDRDALFQIVQNLVDNAIKYANQSDSTRIEVGLEPGADHLNLTVRDYGPGLGEELQGRVFKPFFRGEEREGPQGLGLGLTLVDALATAHGGQVSYKNAEGGGALFTVTFPVS